LILENPQGTVYPLDEFPKELEKLKKETNRSDLWILQQ